MTALKEQFGGTHTFAQLVAVCLNDSVLYAMMWTAGWIVLSRWPNWNIR
ncbi:MAG: hypothetical protein IPO56_15665 [Flavobacteriales bacterium]|nr:hypothetical protein [Flavobacteriales bacterium]